MVLGIIIGAAGVLAVVYYIYKEYIDNHTNF